jgi:hypothetical protein
MIHHFRNGAVRFCTVITVDQQVTGQPVQLAKKRDPQQALFPHRHGRWQNDVEAVTIS